MPTIMQLDFIPIFCSAVFLFCSLPLSLNKITYDLKYTTAAHQMKGIAIFTHVK